MRVVTWNVLHRVHGETHREPCLARWPDEAGRVAAVVDAIRSFAADAVLLQEVSGDLVAALRGALTERAVLNHEYPRVPRRRVDGVQDATEHLVVVAPRGSKVQRAVTYSSDPGKGFLAVEAAPGLTVVSTHVSWGEKRADQLVTLRAAVTALSEVVVLGGDFNVEREVVESALGAACAPLPPKALPTREDEGGRGLFIDHLVAFGDAALDDIDVLPHREESDHRPVSATLRSVPRPAPGVRTK